MVGQLQEYHPIMNVALSLISSILFLEKGGFVSYDTAASETLHLLLKEVCKDVRV